MPGELHTSINNSPTKAEYSFPKNSRFPKLNGLNQNVAYEAKQYFSTAKIGGGGRPFHSTSTRFNYYPSPKKHTRSP